MSTEKKKLPYFSDATLFKRVDKYLDDNIDKQMIDKEAMVDELRNTYKEYQRRNRSAFRIAVFKAYSMINQNILEVTQERSNDGSDVEAVEDCSTTEIDHPAENPVSMPSAPQSYLQGLHSMASPLTRPQKTGNSELINISSDEGEDEPPAKRLAVPPLYPSKVQDVRVIRSHSSDHSFRRGPFDQRSFEMGLRNLEVPASYGSGREVERPKKQKHRVPAVEIFRSEKKKFQPDTIPETLFADFGGYPKVIQSIGDMVLHFCQSDIYDILGVTPPRGLILHGPPGCGKTLLAHAVAGELNLPLVKVSGPELIGGISGESESRIRKVFQQAKQQVPCILFIDEIDVISQTRENARKDMERRIVSQLICCLDALSDSEEGDELLVIGATNRVEELDPGLRRAGRFDKEVCIGIPDRSSREGILCVLCRNLRINSEVSIAKIAELTPGYVAADLKSLISDAAVYAVKRISNKRRDAKSQFAQKAKPTIVNSIPINIMDDNASDYSGSVGDDQEAVAATSNSNVQSSTDLTKTVEANAEMHSSKETSDSSAADDDKSMGSTNKDEGMVEEPTSSDVVEENSALNGKADELKMDVTENGINDDDQKSEDLDACVIIDDSKCENRRRPTGSYCRNGPGRATETPNIEIEMSDILKALKSCQPSAKREGFATVPDVTWDDIGSLKDVRNELKLSIMLPVKYPEDFARMGINAPSGILLWGPPGCGKTLLAKAVANEANINFISVKGPELLNMYVGESEKAVRTCFARARNSQPCVIFFDEIDALCPRRSSSSEGSVSSRVVNQVLTEMDGVEGRSGVFLMAATNRPDMVDPAILRPGRLDKIVKVNIPNAKDREDILRAITKNGTKPPLDKSLSLEKIAHSESCDGFSGADLAALVKEASVIALTEHLNKREERSQTTKADIGQLCVHKKHFDAALEKIKPSVHGQEKKRYEKMESSFSVAQPNS